MEAYMEEIMSLMQEGTFQDYCDTFEKLLKKVEISEDYAVYLFISGLKLEISEVLMGYHNLGSGITLKESFSLAKSQERVLNLDYVQGMSLDPEVSACALQQKPLLLFQVLLKKV